MKSSDTIAQYDTGGMARLVILTACLALLVAACGQKGPLYLPQKEAVGDGAAAVSGPAEPPADSTESSAETSEEKETDEKTP